MFLFFFKIANIVTVLSWILVNSYLKRVSKISNNWSKAAMLLVIFSATFFRYSWVWLCLTYAKSCNFPKFMEPKSPISCFGGYHGNKADFLIFIAFFFVYSMNEENEPNLSKIHFFCVQPILILSRTLKMLRRPLTYKYHFVIRFDLC